MKEYIINAPQLQTVRKRISAVFVWLLCWVMWIYLLIPLVALNNWVMGDKKMINEMRWFGGYKSLLELMEIYLAALVVLALLWLCWIIARALRSQTPLPAAQQVVNDKDLCDFYSVETDDLQQCKNSKLMTVYFDEQGHIAKLEPHITPAGIVHTL
jgi:poly-beta-1,6-N-acetyl-D-glucosamine biosynthesis protein PgaD